MKKVNRKRTVQLNIRLTEDEHFKLVLFAQRKKMSISKYVRAVVFDKIFRDTNVKYVGYAKEKLGIIDD